MRNPRSGRSKDEARSLGRMQPRITSLKVGGFKSLNRERDIKIGSLTVLAGANSSGKSSALQPILLLKQSIEDPRGSTDLVLSGGHTSFTDKSQILSNRNICSGKEPSPLTIGLTVDGEDSMYQSYGASNGRPLEIVSAHYCLPRYGSRDFALVSGMKADQIRTALSNFLPLINPAYDFVDFKAKVESGLLSVTLDLTPKDAKVNGADQPRLFAIEVPFRDPFATCVTQILHVRGVRGIQRQSLNIPPRQGSYPGSMELFTASVLLEWQSKKDPRLKALEEYLVRLCLTSGINARPINDSTVEISVARFLAHSSEMVSIADVGFGVSQVLPVLIALLAADEGHMVYIEQPEVHLHPNAQVMLARIICEAVSRNTQVVIETHSELILLGIQTAVASGTLNHEDVELHWFSQDKVTGEAEIASRSLEPDGSFGEWPADFSSVTLDAQMAYLRSIKALSE